MIKSFLPHSLLPSWASNQWILLCGLIVLSILAFLITQLCLTKIIIHIFKKRNLIYNKKHERDLAIPFGITAFFLIIYLGHPEILTASHAIKIISRCSQIGLTIGAIWATTNLVNILALYFGQLAQKTENKLDDVLIPLLRSFAKLIVWSTGLLFIGHALTIDIKNIIAGLGIGGIALALAAKDTLSNFFGSVMLILDRPFEIGDWISLENGVEGIVVQVGFRSTRIKTFYDSEISIPNSMLGNMHVDNYGRRKYRRFYTKIGIQYDTPTEKIEAFCEGIRRLILEQADTRKEYFHVYLNELGSSSLDIIVYVFWKVPNWSEELTHRHRFLVDILRLGHDMEIEFAFPTQTLHLYNEDKKEPKTIEKDFHQQGQNLAQHIAKKRISPLKPRSSLDETKTSPLD